MCRSATSVGFFGAGFSLVRDSRAARLEGFLRNQRPVPGKPHQRLHPDRVELAGHQIPAVALKPRPAGCRGRGPQVHRPREGRVSPAASLPWPPFLPIRGFWCGPEPHGGFQHELATLLSLLAVDPAVPRRGRGPEATSAPVYARHPRRERITGPSACHTPSGQVLERGQCRPAG